MSSNTNQATEQEFGPIRKMLWPIHNYELKKFLPLGLIMFCILFNYTLLRDTKDTLVVNASGASAITFLKLYCVTPCAILFVIFYAKLTNMLKREHVFYTVVTPFLIFFGLFGFVLYPNLDALHPSQEMLATINAAYPRLSGFVDIFAYWSYSLFYVLAEIWGSAMIALMFWQFANQIVRMKESKRFYGLFVVIGNVALILSGFVVTFCSESIKDFFPGQSPEQVWEISLKWLMGAVVVMGILSMMLYRWMHTNVLTDPRYYDGDAVATGSGKTKKKKPGLVESFKIIISSPELGLIAMLIMAYGVTINLVEVQWKEQLKFYFAGDRGGYNGFMGQYSLWTGVITIAFSLFIGSNILRILSWFKAAVITPVFILLGGGLFFAFILSSKDIMYLKDFVADLLLSIGTNPITAATFLGAGIVILSKSIKYSLFDPTKEMAYIPLDDELKTKGKAAVDVIGGRAGKAGGAFVQNMLFLAFATKDAIAIAPIAFGVFAAVCLLWIFSVKLLSKKVNAAAARRVEQEREAAGAAPATTAQTA
ncbi:MAG TPA: Npt1/Npt2 family nucleotide transporter [Gammaproteobacteria bacterium]|nr:Npt1/Npt2 family nucleotide transporter [Gammaproteobacteria bacterium]